MFSKVAVAPLLVFGAMACLGPVFPPQGVRWTHLPGTQGLCWLGGSSSAGAFGSPPDHLWQSGRTCGSESSEPSVLFLIDVESGAITRR